MTIRKLWPLALVLTILLVGFLAAPLNDEGAGDETSSEISATADAGDTDDAGSGDDAGNAESADGDQTNGSDQGDGSAETDSADQGQGDAEEVVPTQMTDLPPISIDSLPGEALDTLDLIGSGGPFPFDRDDLVFENREGLLPDRELGHYREYTVITPGEDDRGARRIVAGAAGELFYTADHYSSFSEIVFEPIPE
jgi:ribonuclease T1